MTDPLAHTRRLPTAHDLITAYPHTCELIPCCAGVHNELAVRTRGYDPAAS
jgi:hypothetical protein